MIDCAACSRFFRSVKEAKCSLMTNDYRIFTDPNRNLRTALMGYLGFPIEIRWNQESLFFVGCTSTKWNSDFSEIENLGHSDSGYSG